MAVTLGSIIFDDSHTTVEERLEEVGGRDERRVTISGFILNKSDVLTIEAELDGILDAASAQDYSAVLSLRTGRRLFVRRDRFERSVEGERLTGSFSLVLLAKDPVEESMTETSVDWNVSTSGDTQGVTPGGNIATRPKLTLACTGTVTNPAISDGVRTMTYSGIVGDGETLIFDGPNRIATLEGVDVTPYTSGDFPQASPEGTTLTYTYSDAAAHSGVVTIAFRDRWW